MTSFLCIKIKTFAGLISELKYKIIGSLNSNLQMTRIEVIPDEEQDFINPNFVRVYKQGKNIFITIEGYTKKYLLANHEYKLGLLNYAGALPVMTAMPILISNNNNFYIGYFYISMSGTDRIVRFRTPDFPEKDINYVSGSHIVFL